MNSSIHDWTGAYAAHSLSDDECEDFERHLADCGACRAEVDSFAAVLADLTDADGADADGADADGARAHEGSLEVPAGLGAAVMAEVARTPQDRVELIQDLSVASVAHVPGSAGAPPAAGSTATDLDAARERRSPRGGLGWGSRLLATAAAVLAVAAVGVGVVLGSNSPDPELVAAVTQADDAASHDFGWEDASLVVSEQTGAFALTGHAPVLAEGQEYQLWIVHTTGEITPGPTFTHGDFAEAVEVNLADVATVALSVEPAGGSAQPTTTPVAALDL